MIPAASTTHANLVVAPADASDELKAHADLVCDGVNDQQVLAASLAAAPMHEVDYDINPAEQRRVRCHARHRVAWLAGTYHLSDTLEIPSSADCAIDALGTYMLYAGDEGDAIVVRGANRCRYAFGTIESRSSGAAIAIRPGEDMPTLMTDISFTGLIGHAQRGTGLLLDPSTHNVCVDRIQGTDIAGFNTGVHVRGAQGQTQTHPGAGKCDTNWYWLSYIRMCNTCIHEENEGVDSAVWEVNIDASLPGSVAARIGGCHGLWSVIMGQWVRGEGERATKAIVLEPGATGNTIQIHPALKQWDWEDNSGNDTNAVIDADGMMRRFRR